MATIECSQPASKSSWDSQDFGDISMVLKMAHVRKSTGPRWVKRIKMPDNCVTHKKILFFGYEISDTKWAHANTCQLDLFMSFHIGLVLVYNYWI